MATTNFKVGSIYGHTWATNSDMLSLYVVTKRTKCFIWIDDIYNGVASGKPKKRKVSVGYNDSEMVLPTGSYSMAPTLWASDCYDDEPDNTPHEDEVAYRGELEKPTEPVEKKGVIESLPVGTLAMQPPKAPRPGWVIVEGNDVIH